VRPAAWGPARSILSEAGEHGALRLASHALYHDRWCTTGAEDMRPLRAYDFVLALDGDLRAHPAPLVRWRGARRRRPAGSKAAARHADGPGAWFLTVARGVEPDMLVVAVDAWDALVGTADAARAAAKKGKKGGKAKK
jgi:hypothetical protein